MLFKTLVLVALLAIVASLGIAMFTLVRDKGKSDRVLKALTVRIGLSVALFVALMAAYAAGLITPHGIMP
ncbi:MAG TPA: twin transmembrane helix small protein [Gammaproteobacteria bacterium]|nr:twin transmembrane helix small protein [Gammaproteobacteria bacterium]